MDQMSTYIPLLSHHIIDDECIVPAALLLQLTTDNNISNIIFKKKIDIHENIIWSEDKNMKIAKLIDGTEIFSYKINYENIDTIKISNFSYSKVFCKKEIYNFFNQRKCDYGYYFQVIQNIFYDEKNNVGKVILKGNDPVTILDGTFQAIVFIQNNSYRCIPAYIKNFLKFPSLINENKNNNNNLYIGYFNINGDFQIVNQMTDQIIFLGKNAIFRKDKEKMLDNNINIGISSYAFKLPNGVNSMDKLYNFLIESKTSNCKNGRINYPGNYLQEDVSLFDAQFFDISKSEACKMDPQHRLLLEVCYECLEKSGLINKNENIGFFVGYMGSEYSELLTTTNSLSLLGVTTSAVSGRLNYFFNSNGPSIVVDTACSSSLVALEMACNAIKNKSCNKAIVAGVSLIISENSMEKRIKGRMISPDGRCYSFDQRANGYGRSEGVVAILVEPLNDNCEVEILSTAINHTGKSVSLTTPNELSQKMLLKNVLSNENLFKVDYWEAHGTGTKLGDPIEIRALDTVLKDSNCYVGTIKANFGHTEAASGLMGVLKVILQMKHNIIFKHPDLEMLNDEIETNSIKIARDNIQKNISISGVSSFGIAGTNAMALLKKYIPIKKNYSEIKCGIILISGASQKSLDQNLTIMFDYVKKNYDKFDIIGLESIFKRKHYKFRGVILRNMKCYKMNDEIEINSIFFKNNFPVHLPSNDIKNNFELNIFLEKVFPYEELSSIKDKNFSFEYIEFLAAKYFLLNKDIDYSLIYGKEPLKLPNIKSYPSYQFDRQRYWFSDENKKFKINDTKSNINNKIKNIIEEEIGRNVSETDTFTDLGLDSLSLTNLAALISKIDGIPEVTIEDLFEYSTIEKLTNEINKRNEIKILSYEEENFDKKYLMYNVLPPPETSLTTIDVDLYFIFMNSSGTWQLVKKENEVVFSNQCKKQNIKIGIDVTNVSNDNNHLQTLILCFNMFVKELLEIKKKNNGKDISIKIGFICSSHLTTVGNSLYSMLKSLISEYFPEISFISDELSSIILQGIYVPKILKELLFYEENCTWIVTGGSKGIGLELVNFIIKKSLSSVKVYSLSRKNVCYNNFTDNIIQRNGDVSDYDFVLSVVKEIADSGRKLKGIIHNAGVILDKFAINQNYATFNKVWLPKVQGLFNLEKALNILNIRPDYFICSSSISSILGNQGQINYSSANAFLDEAMKVIRKEWKICALTINWGNWLETGISERKQLNKTLEKKGLIGLKTKEALMCLEYVFQMKSDNVIIANIEWDKIMGVRNDLKCLQIMDSIEIINKTESNLHNNIESIFNFKQKIIQTLKDNSVSLNEYDFDNKNFFELGIDSLFLHDLVNDLKKQIPNIKLKVIDLFEHSNINELSIFIKNIYEEKLNENQMFTSNEKLYFENHHLNDYPICPGMLQIYKFIQKTGHFIFKEIKFHNMLTLKNADNTMLVIENPNKIIMKNKIGDGNLMYISGNLSNESGHFAKIDFKNSNDDIIISSDTINLFYATLYSYGFNYGPKLQLLHNCSIRLKKIEQVYTHASCIVNEYFNILDNDIEEKEWCLFEIALQLLAYLSYFIDKAFINNKESLGIKYTLVPIVIDKIQFPNIKNIKSKLTHNNSHSYSFAIKVNIVKIGNDIITGNANFFIINKNLKNDIIEKISIGFIENVTAKKLYCKQPKLSQNEEHLEPSKSKKPFLKKYQSLNLVESSDNLTTTSKSLTHLFSYTNSEKEYASLITSNKKTNDNVLQQVDADLIRVESNKSLIKVIADRKISSMSENYQKSPKSSCEDFFFENNYTRKRSTSLNLTKVNYEYQYNEQKNEKRIFLISCSCYYPSDIDKRGLSTFDNVYFKISPLEAKYLDPQQRILLELTSEALQNINLPSNETGVFIGACTSDFAMKCFKELRETELSKFLATGTGQNMLSGKISNFFNFTGPSLTVDTACSSFMTALFLAYIHLKNGLCKYAIVGGVNVILNSEIELVLKNNKVISESKKCKPLDFEADGYTRSQGAGVFILQADFYSEYPEILASSLSHTGSSINVNVPNIKKEEELMRNTIKDAKITVDDIDLIEIHGTGTKVGDKIEMEAINNVFKNVKNKVYITASKGKYGHCEGASGLISLSEMLKTFDNNCLEGINNFHKLNCDITLNDNIIICQKNTTTLPKIGLINCFGFSGTNSCIIIKKGFKSPFVKRLPWIMETLWPFSNTSQKNIQKISYVPLYFSNETVGKKDLNDIKIFVESYKDVISSLKKWRTMKYNCMNYITTSQNNGLHGMLKSIEKEKKLFKYRLFILEDKSILKNFNINNLFTKNTENKTILITKSNKLYSKEIVNDKININITTTKIYKKIFITGGNGGVAREILNQFKYHEALLLSQGPLNRKLSPSQYYIQGNIEDLELVKSIFNLNPDIDCIIHTAGIVKNGMIDNLSSDDFEKVLLPKVKGLDNLFKNIKECLSVQTVIVLSSVAAIYGSVGQSNYALANDSMSEKCLDYFNDISRKIQCLIFDLGPIKGTGMLYKNIEGMDKIRKQIENSDWEMLNIQNVVNEIKIFVDNDISGRFGLFKIKEKINIKNNGGFKLSKKDVKEHFLQIIKNITGFENIDEDKGFMLLGFDSIMLETMREQIEKTFEIKINIEELFEYSNTTELVKLIENRVNEKYFDREKSSEKIAIIGYSGTFSGSKNCNEYFNNLINGKECFEKRYDIKYKKKNFVPYGGVIPNYDSFNETFLDLPHETVIKLDPQIKHFVHQVGKALKSCNIDIKNSKIGIIASAEPSTPLKNINNNEIYGNLLNLFNQNQKDFISLWTAYLYNFTGPAFNVYSACSSSIIAIKQAINILLQNEADIMVVGCVSLQSPSEIGHEYAPGLMMASEPHCRPFCSNATGIIRGSGCGILILKLLENAFNDGDEIHAVINGISINNDGKNKSNFLAPTVKGQETVIRNAIIKSNLTNDEIDYIECHCTGTVLGDKIELKALKKVFGENKIYRVAKGSVKANIGHCFAASGMASIIKVIEMMKHQQIPIQLHCENFIYPQYIKHALVNSFGIGGSNGSLILSNTKERLKINQKTKEISYNKTPLIFPFSAPTKYELIEKLDHFHTLIEKENLEINFLPIWKTILEQNLNLPWRCYLVGNDFSSLMKYLKNKNYNFYYTEKSLNSSNIAFYCCPQGVEYKYMGEELLNMNEFKEEVDKIATKFGINIFDQCFMEEIHSTLNAQLGLFLISQCLINCLLKFGISCNIYFGHSLGEYTALVASGWLKTKETLDILKNRGKLMESTEEAVMLAVKGINFIDKLNELKANKLISENDIEISAILNAQICCVVGKKENTDKLKNLLLDCNFEFKNLRTRHGFHTSMINSILDKFKVVLNNSNFINNDNISKKNVISNVNGKFIGSDKPLSTTYFLEHARNPVRLDLSLKMLKEITSINTIFEIGPQGILGNIISNEKFLLLNTIQGKAANLKEKRNILIESIGRLWCEGYNNINFSGNYDLDSIADYFIDFTFSTFNFWKMTFEIEDNNNSSNSDVIVLSEFDYVKIKQSKYEWAKMNNINISFTVEKLNKQSILMCALLSEIQCLNPTISIQISLNKQKNNNFISKYSNTFAYTSLQKNKPSVLKYKKLKYIETFLYNPQSVIIFGANGCIGKLVYKIIRNIFPKTSIFTCSTSFNVDVRVKDDVTNFLNSVISSGESIDNIVFCCGLHPHHQPEEDILDVKYKGIKNIADYLNGRSLKANRIVLISSLSSMLGILNEEYYAGSNIFFDILSLSIPTLNKTFNSAFDSIISLQLPPVLDKDSMFFKGKHEEKDDFHELFKENGIQQAELEEKLKIIFRSNQKGIVCISKHNPEIIRQIVSHNQQLVKNNFSKDIFVENTSNISLLKERVREVWKDVLGSYPKNDEITFFEAGGNSLSILHFIWKLHENFTLDMIYENSSFMAIVKALKKLLKNDKTSITLKEKKYSFELDMNWAQKSMMLLKEINDNEKYNIVFTIKLFDSVCFKKKFIETLHKIIKFQPGLRSKFLTESFKIHLLSLTESFYYLKTSNWKKNLIKEELRVHFDYNEGCPMRLKIFKKNNDLIIVINQQHIMTDGWSMSIFAKYFEMLWNNNKIDSNYIVLPHDEIWKFTKNENTKSKVKEYLNNHNFLFNVMKPTQLFSHEGIINKKHNCLKFNIPTNLFSKIKEISIEKGLTKFIFLLTGFIILVECWNENFDDNYLYIGVPVSGRSKNYQKNIIGCFLNNILLIIEREMLKKLKGNINEILKYVHSQFIKAKLYENVPFNKIVSKLNLPRSTSNHPLFEVFFNYRHELDYPVVNLRDIKKTKVKQISRNTIFDFSMTIDEVNNNLQVTVDFNEKKYSTNYIKSVIKDYLIILKELTIEKFTRKRVKQECFNIPSTSIQELIRKQMFSFEKSKNVFERCLQKSFIIENDYFLKTGEILGPDFLLGINYKNLSVEFILSIILTSSGYVPFNENINENIDGNIFVIQSNTLCNIKIKSCLKYRNRNKNNDLLYCLYTSGTTGKRKGVLVDQKSVINFLFSTTKSLFINQDCYFLDSIRYTFDMSIFNIFMSLMMNSELIIIRNINQPVNDIDFNSNISHILLSSAVFNNLSNEDLNKLENMGKKQLKYLIVGGETPSTKQIEKCRRRNIFIVQIYGPTETTIWVTEKKNPFNGNNIGKEIKNTIVKLKNKTFYRESYYFGEIVIEGYCVCRSYLGSKNKIDKYWSGDIGLRKKNNDIKYYGRINDDFVKIKGARVNIKYIENSLKQIYFNDNIVVLKIKDSLVAFIKSDKNIQKIDKFVNKIITTKNFPITTNGKIDKQKLLSFFTDNKNPHLLVNMNSKLTTLWYDIFPIKNLTKDSNFFIEGGNSLSLIKLRKNIEEEFKISVSVNELYQQPTFGRMEEIIINKCISLLDNPVKIIKENSDSDTIIYVFYAIGGTLYPFYNMIQFFNYEIRGFEYNGELENCSLLNLAQYYAKYIAIDSNKNIFLMGHSLGGILAREVYLILEKNFKKLCKLQKNVIMLDSWALRINKLDLNIVENYIKEKFAIIPNNKEMIRKSLILAKMLKEHVITFNEKTSMQLILLKAKSLGSSSLKHSIKIEPLDKYVRSCIDNGWLSYSNSIKIILIDGDHDSILHFKNNQKWIEKLKTYLMI
uniref:Polybromo-1 n=1 Tax=Strongyloides stercoralis TaxID=6248 RepID=A0AAF5DP94_STRER